MLWITAIFPPLELFLLHLWVFVQRSYDQSRCCGKRVPESTRKKTLKAYKDLYCGIVFDIHYQYSQMLVITWVTFLFAPGLPILFPIALFGMVVLYVTNRIGLAYFNRRPPGYDSKMNENTISILGFAPILYACVGSWVYSNQ